jgi:hypothetical protein
VHVERLRVAKVVRSPHPVDELAAGEHTAGVAQEQLEELEFLQRHRHLAPVDRDLVAVNIHAHAAGLEHAVIEVLVVNATAQNRPDAREQFTSRIRLRHVIVGPELKPDHDVDLAVLCGQHDDRNAGTLPQFAAHLGAGKAGQHQVEKHQFGTGAVEFGERLNPVGGDARLVALAGEQVRQWLGERGLVFDNEDAGHERTFCFGVEVGADAAARGSRMVNVDP